MMCKENMKSELNISKFYYFSLLNFTGILMWQCLSYGDAAPCDVFREQQYISSYNRELSLLLAPWGMRHNCMAAWEVNRCDTTWTSCFTAVTWLCTLVTLVQLWMFKYKEKTTHKHAHAQRNPLKCLDYFLSMKNI